MSAIAVERLLTWTNCRRMGVAQYVTDLIFYNITRCYGKHVAVFAVAVAMGDIIKYQSFVYGSFVSDIHVRYNNNKCCITTLHQNRIKLVATDNSIKQSKMLTYSPIVRWVIIWNISHSFLMREADAHTVRLRQETFNNNGGHEAWFGHFLLPITALFMVRNIKCGYSFS